jgi:putative endonuclease
MLIFLNRAPVAQLDQSVWLRTRRSGVQVSPGAPFLLMFFVYVLRNRETERHYTGHTSNLVQRVGQHNHGVTKSTKNRGQWDLLYHEEFDLRSDAMRREKYLKSGKGREELRRKLAQPPGN